MILALWAERSDQGSGIEGLVAHPSAREALMPLHFTGVGGAQAHPRKDN